MPYLSPPTLTKAKQQSQFELSASHPRDHIIFSLALGTGPRLSEIVGLNVDDVFTSDGKPRNRIRLCKEIAKGGRAGDVFLPDALGRHLASDPVSQRRISVIPRRELVVSKRSV